jgi:hypothetical protein
MKVTNVIHLYSVFILSLTLVGIIGTILLFIILKQIHYEKSIQEQKQNWTLVV